jgi:uncharacterized protein
MASKLLKLYGPALVLSSIILILIGTKNGLSALFSVMVLAGLEITFSFDNAVVNAKILEKMNRFWQEIFMTVGIAIAVFGVRVLLPIVLVASTARVGIGTVVDLALHHPDDYASKLQASHPAIASFGGIFLLMLFLNFMFHSRSVKWLRPIEERLEKIGELEHAAIIVTLFLLTLTTTILVPEAERFTVLFAGLIGMSMFLLINALDAVAERPETRTIQTHLKKLALSGIGGFLYLELIDASFSLDGVIGAFAITNKIVLIAAGLGIGALFVRSMTVHMLRDGVLQKYRYMEHGAHYAIGVLALLMLWSIKFAIPDYIAGLSGVVFIGLAIVQSHKEMRNENARN